MKIKGLSLHEVALFARGTLVAVEAARRPEYDVGKEGPALTFLRACDAFSEGMPPEVMKDLGTFALLAKDANTTRDSVMQAVTFVTASLSPGAPPAPVYDALVSRLRTVSCISGAELVMSLSWHKKTGSHAALASIAMSLAFWVRRAERWDLAPAVLAMLMGFELVEKENRTAA